MNHLARLSAFNTVVLSQGVRRNYHLLIALICSVCDALLIVIGISGVGAVLMKTAAYCSA
jgi:L-lysine exporter family protein LysE/ArgO